MNRIKKALIWAAVILGFALAASAGFVSDDLALVMLIILPVLAWLSIGGARNRATCTPADGKEEV